MNDHELERLLREAAPGYRVPVDPPLDRMWNAIEARAFGSRLLRYPRSRWLRPLAFAATLVVGVGLGYAGARLRPPGAAPTPVPPVETPAVVPSPFVGVASDYLEQTTALMVTVAGNDAVTTLTPATVTRARDLLSTTRLLLDAGLESVALRELLQDIELVLAQVVRLPESPRPAETRFVTDAVTERDVLPRLTLFLADARAMP